MEKRLLTILFFSLVFVCTKAQTTYTVRLGPGLGDCGTVENPCPKDCTVGTDNVYTFFQRNEYNTILTATITQVNCGDSDEYLFDKGESLRMSDDTFYGDGKTEINYKFCGWGVTGLSTNTHSLDVELKADHPEEAIIIEYTIYDFSFDLLDKLMTKGYICYTAIPVELYSFTADITPRNDVLLKWITASETNNKGFEIERSYDGSNFEQIGFEKGHNYSSETKEYTFIDKRPISGTCYYRLKQIDFDGRFEYSEIQTVKIPKSSIKLIGNIVNDILNFQIDNKSTINVSYTILNSVGKVVQEGSLMVDKNISTININNLINGHYFININNQENRLITERFIVFRE